MVGIKSTSQKFLNNFAISSAGIGEALQRSASALATAGNTIEESIGMIVAANDVVQNPEAVGTAMKTLTMYLRAAKTEAEEAGISVDGMASSTAKLRNELLALTGGKLDIQIDDKNFKSSFQILKELSELWDEIGEKSGDVTQANILNLLGGKRNANVLSSIITNFQDAIDAMETASDSAGSAFAENEKYLDSIEGKTKKVEAAFQTFANSVLNSGLVKAFLDIQNGILNVVSALSDAGLLLPTVVALGVAIKTIRDNAVANAAIGKISDILFDPEDMKAAKIAAQDIFNTLTMGQQKLAASKLGSIGAEASAGMREFATGTQQAAAGTSVLGASMDALKLKAAGLGAAMKALVGSVGFWITIATLAISIGSKIAESIRKAREETIQAAHDISDAYNSSVKDLNNDLKTLDGMKEEFNELNKGVDENGKNTGLAADKYDRYLQLVKQIKEISPELARSYTDEGKALKNGYISILDEAIEKQNEYIENAERTYYEGGRKMFTGYQNELQDLKKSAQSIFPTIRGYFMEDGDDSILLTIFNAVNSNLDVLFDAVEKTMADTGKSLEFDWGDADWMYAFYQNREIFLDEIEKSGLVVGEDFNKMQSLFASMEPFVKEYREDTDELVKWYSVAVKYFSETSEIFADGVPTAQLADFQDGLRQVIEIDGATVEENRQAVIGFALALNDVYTRMDSLKEASSWKDVTPDIAYLKELYKGIPGIADIIDRLYSGWQNVSESEKDAANGADAVTQSYENLEKVLSKISGFNTFLNNARNGKGSEDPFGMISAAKDVADAYNEIVAVSDDIPKIDWTNMVSEVGENGEILWNTSGIEYYIDAIINAAAANTEFTKNNPEVVAWLQQMAKGFDEAAASAKSLGDAMGSMESIDGLIKRINEYDGDDSEAFDIINELQKFVDEWNKIRTAPNLDPIDITKFVTEKNGNVSFANTIAALGEFRDAVINDNTAMQELKATAPGLYAVITTMGTQAEDAANGVLTLEDAISSLGDIASVLQEGIGGDTIADQITNAEKLAEGYNSVLRQLGDLGLTDEAADFGWREFLTIDDGIITENKARIQEYYTALVDLIVENMAKLHSLEDGEKASMKSSLLGWVTSQLDADEVKRKAEETKDAFSEIKDITSYQADLASYRAGETSYFDMLERMYDLAAQYDDIDLKDLWDFDASAFKDIGDIQLDKMIDKLATDLEINENEVEDWKNHVKKSFEEAEEAVSAYETATKSINLADSLNGFLADTRSGDKDPLTMLSSAVSLAEDLGLKLEEVVSVGAGGKMTFNTDALTTAFEKYIDDLVTAGSLNKDLAAQIKNAAKAEGELAEEAKTAAERMADALSNMQSLYSFMQSGTAGDSDILTVLENAQKQFEAYQKMVDDGLKTTPLDIFSFISIDSGGIRENVETAKKLYADMADQMVSEWIAETKKANAGKSGLTLLTGEEEWANGLTPEQAAWFNQIKTQILGHLNDLNAEVEPTVGDIINNLQSLFDFQNKINTGESVDFTSVYDDLENLKTILGDQTLNLGDIIKWQDGDFQYAFDKTDLLSNKIEQYTNDVVTALGLTGDEAVAASNKIKAALGMQESAFTKINNTIAKVKSAGSFSETIDSFTKGDTSLIDMFSEAASIAEELGLTMDQVWDFDGMRPKAEAVYAAIDKAVEEMAEGRNYSEEFKQQLKEAARYAAETASAQSKVKTAYDSYGSLVSGMTSVGENVELTYERYLTLIEADARYANAIEYMNGQLTINKQRYVEITEAIGQETIAIAQQRIEQIRSSDAYVQYAKEYEKYGTKMDATHLAALQNMELEIRGYQTLAAEIRNASTEFARFLNASDETSGTVYKGMQNARQIIDDTLNNKDSDRYLKTGNEKYQLAYNVLIGENVDVNSSAFDEAFKRVNRYLEDGVSGYNNFVNDLIENNFVDGAGNLSGTVDQMAEKLGITKDLVRAMLEEARQYGAEIDWSKIDPEVAEGAAEKTKTIFDTIADLGNALDEIKTNKLDIGADAEAEEIATTNQRLIETEEILKRINKNKLIFAGTNGIPSGAKYQIGQDYIPEDYNGNVDLLSRKIIPLKMMVDVGWNVDDSDGWATLFSTTYSGGDFSFTGPEADMIVSVTPITPEGQILSESELGDYVYELFEESQKTGKSIAEIDAQKLNLLIDIDTKQPEESLDAAFDRISEKMIRIHELQEQWDLVRSQFNFFGDGSDQYGVFSGVEEGADSAKESVENLSNTSVNNDTSGAVANIGSVQSAAENAIKALNKLDGKKVTATVDVKYEESNESTKKGGFGDFFSGLFSGSSAAGGTHGISNGGRTLVGELGREIVVDTDRGEWYTVGNRGPEFVNLPKNGIVFSNKDTEEILRRGGVAKSNGGRAHANTGFLGGLIDGAKKIWDNVKTLFSTSGDKILGSGFKPKDDGKGKKQGKQAVDEAKQLEEALTKIKEAFEALNKEYEHYIAHQEQSYYLSERATDYTGMQDALEQEAEYYRKIYTEAMKAVDEMKAAGADDTSEDLQAIEEAAWTAYQSMMDAHDKIRALLVDALGEEVDAIQSAFQGLKDAVEQYNETGKITIDTFQSLLEGGLQYLQFLIDEDGQLKINVDGIRAMLQARKDQLAVETAMSYLSRIREAAENGETGTLQSLIDSTNTLTESTWGLVEAQAQQLLTSGLVTQEQYDQIMQNIEAAKKLAQVADDDLSVGDDNRLAKTKEHYEDLNEQIEHYIKHLEQAQKVSDRFANYNGVEESLREQIAEYRKIIENCNRAIEEMKAEGADDTTKELQEMEEKAWSAQQSIWSLWDALYSLRTDAITNRIDTIQASISDFSTAMDEIAESGSLSLDTFQAILENGLQYLQFLNVENGQLSLNTEAVEQMIRAKKEQLAVETAMSYLNQIEEALLAGEATKVQELVWLNEQLSESTWAAVYAKLALLKTEGLSDEDALQVESYIEKLQNLSSMVETNIAAPVVQTMEDILGDILEQFNEIKEDLEHYIAHQEQKFTLDERAMDFGGMSAALHNEINYYSQIYAEAQKTIGRLLANGADDTTAELQEVEEAAWSAYNSMNDAFDKMNALRIDALNEELDRLTGTYSNLQTAIEEFEEDGKISLDSFEQLLNGGIQYLTFLEKEDGQYKLNEQSIQDYLSARKEQLAIETALSYLANIKQALQNGEVQRVHSLIDATNELSTGTWDLVFAQAAELKMLGLSDGEYNTLIDNLNKLRDLSKVVETNLATGDDADPVKDVADAFSALNKELEHYIAHQEQAFKERERAWDFTGMENALKNEVQYYKRIVEEGRNAINEMKLMGADDTNEAFQNVEETVWSASNSMYEALDKIRTMRIDALTNEIDNLSKSFNNFKGAADEYNQTGGITLDTFNSIVEGGMQYLSLLDEENGKYVIANDRLQDYIQMRKEQLAIETAMSYVSEIREALENDEEERVRKLIDATNGLSSSTWDLVYAQAAALKAEGLSNEQYETIVGNIDRLRALATAVNTDLTDAGENLESQYKDQEDALDRILKFTEDLIRAEAKDRIQAIKDEIEAYKEIIALKKESLQQTKQETEYQDEVADKIKEIAQLQAKADLLSLDTSRTASAERQRLLQDIQSKQDELSKYQADHAYDAQVEALDKEAEAYEKSRQDEIAAIEASVSSEEKVYQLAIARIRDQWDTLYEDLINWNTEQGSVINQEITDAWEDAFAAVQKYGDYLSALAGVKNDIAGLNANGSLVVADIPKYHGGGVAGDKGKLNDEEVLAVLQKGELVVDKEQKKGLYAVVDFVKSLGERLGTKIGSLANLGMTGQMMPAFAGMAEPSSAGFVENNNITFNPSFNVNINGEVGDPASAREYGRTLAQTAADSLFDAFNRRGINIVQTLRQ